MTSWLAVSLAWASVLLSVGVGLLLGDQPHPTSTVAAHATTMSILVDRLTLCPLLEHLVIYHLRPPVSC
ncbi:MAG: hypothetical protein IKE22_09090, partial [Atopobiaceae bacterium]|nr:hypothetical protein [Atopobiaceae bacterium]